LSSAIETAQRTPGIDLEQLVGAVRPACRPRPSRRGPRLLRASAHSH